MPPIPDDQWLPLVPRIERLANRVATRKNASPTVRDTLLAEAVTHVFDKRDAFDGALGAIEPWCWRVLANLCVSLIRNEAAENRRRARYRSAEEYRQAGQLRPRRASPTDGSPDDFEERQRPRPDLVAFLERLPQPMDRLLLATYAGVLDDCGHAVVNRWCHEAKCDRASDLLGIATMPKRERKRALAETLDRQHDWVRTRIYRALRMLQDGGDAKGGP